MVLLLATAGALAPASQSQPPAREADRPLQAWTTTRLPFESPHGLVIVTARLEDDQEARLLVDTGDPAGLTLDERFARGIGLSLDGGAPARTSGIVGTRPYVRRRGRLRRLRLGTLEAEDVSFATAPDTEGFGSVLGAPLHGYIGVTLLRRLVVTIDYPGRQISLGPSRPDAHRRGDGILVPLRLRANRLVAEAVLNGVAHRSVIVDTGSAATLVDAEDLSLTLPAGGERVRIFDGARGSDALNVRILPSLRLGALTLEGVRVLPYDFRRLRDDPRAELPEGVAIVLGASVLAGHTIVLDLPERELRITREDP